MFVVFIVARSVAATAAGFDQLLCSFLSPHEQPNEMNERKRAKKITVFYVIAFAEISFFFVALVLRDTTNDE